MERLEAGAREDRERLEALLAENRRLAGELEAGSSDLQRALEAAAQERRTAEEAREQAGRSGGEAADAKRQVARLTREAGLLRTRLETAEAQLAERGVNPVVPAERISDLLSALIKDLRGG